MQDTHNLPLKYMIVWGFQNFAHKFYISHRFAEVKIFHSTPTSNTSKQQLKNSFEKRRLEVTKCKIYRHALCFAIFRTKKSLNSEKAGKKCVFLIVLKTSVTNLPPSYFLVSDASFMSMLFLFLRLVQVLHTRYFIKSIKLPSSHSYLISPLLNSHCDQSCPKALLYRKDLFQFQWITGINSIEKRFQKFSD